MFEQAFKNIDDTLRKEAGCTTELDYTEQTSWLLFLKYLDDLEQERAMEAELDGKKYLAQRIDAANQFVELEDRFARGVMRRQGAQFPDQNALAHLFEPQRGNHPNRCSASLK